MGDLGTEIGCGPADVDICIYKCVTERERKVTTKHENSEWERHDIMYQSLKTTACTRHGDSNPLMRETRVKDMVLMT